MSDADADKWNAIYRQREGIGDPAGLLDRIADHLPTAGRALDIAGGAGRNALWLARRGLTVTIVDVSEVGLEMASTAAAREQLSITTQLLDLESAPLPCDSRWDVVFDFHYLDRDIIRQLDSLLTPGGVFVFCQPTARNLEKHDRPSRRFLLELGEARTLVPEAVEVLHYIEDWSPEGRHEVELVCRLPHVA